MDLFIFTKSLKMLVFWTGGLASSGHADNPHHPHARDLPEPASGGHPQRPEGLVPAHQGATRD